MQFTVAAFVKLSVFAVMANTAAVVALPEPVGLEARQTDSCSSINFCTPGAANACSCPSAVCTGLSLSLLGLSLPGVCLPSACEILCSKTTDCCTNVANTTFTCELIPGQTVGVCLPHAL